MGTPSTLKSRVIAGSYDRKGSRLEGKSFNLLIQQRKASKQTQAKAASYLLLKPKPGEQLPFSGSYLSSLWETSTPGMYELEVSGVRYVLELGHSTAYIRPKESNVKGTVCTKPSNVKEAFK